jgi:hypothetical protein
MRQIKIPETYIKLLSSMESTKQFYIDTPFGKTRSFHPKSGLAQGDITSLLEWNIFYDPLLCILEKNTEGYKIPGIIMN